MASKDRRRGAHVSWAAKLIRSERKRQKLSQVELAEKSGLSVQNVRMIEWECNSPRFESMEKLLNALGYELRAIKGNEQLEWLQQCGAGHFLQKKKAR
jgi:transcriptional regulator with XRE-family HTH domain